MKTTIFTTALLGLFALVSCNKSDDFTSPNDVPLAILNVDADGISTLTRASVAPVLTVTDSLSADEIEFQFALREDEKMARDLYTVFAAKYSTAPQIDRIAAAENSHIACVEAVLDYYEISYPAMTAAAGLFEDAKRQAIYNELADKSGTLLEVYATMAAVEEESVSAYKSVQSEITNENIALVITNMIKASSNHLKAAVCQIIAGGGTYTPLYLSAEEFGTIVNLPYQNGYKYGQKKGRGGNTNAQKGNKGQGNKGGVNGTGSCTGTSNGIAPGTGAQGGGGKGCRGGR